MDKTITFSADCTFNVDLLKDLMKKSDNKIYDLSNPDWLKIGSYIDKKYFVCQDTASRNYGRILRELTDEEYKIYEYGEIIEGFISVFWIGEDIYRNRKTREEIRFLRVEG